MFYSPHAEGLRRVTLIGTSNAEDGYLQSAGSTVIVIFLQTSALLSLFKLVLSLCFSISSRLVAILSASPI